VEYKVTASTEGYLAQTLIEEGDRVQAGQLLFRLYNPLKAAQQQSALAMVQQTAPATAATAPVFQELQQRLELAAARLQNDSLQYGRFKNLYDQNAVSKATFEKHQLQFQASQRDVAALQQQLKGQRLTLNIQQQQAGNQLTVSNADAATLLLKSYADGLVYEVYKEKGDLIVPNQPLALIGSSNLIARLLVDEEDLNKVWVGQKVLITADAFPDKVFKASVKKIYPVLSKVEQSFRVDAILEDALPQAIYGLNVEANIICSENKRITVIPKKALLKGDSVLIRQGNNIAKVKISKGVADQAWVEVRSGIDDHSLIIVQP
jgi:multidrug resistance efflux pump